MRHLKSGLVVAGIGCLALAGCGKKVETAKDASGVGEPAAATAPAAPAATAAVDAKGMPVRRAGLWRESMSAEGMPAPYVTKLCLDAAAGKKMSIAGSQMSDASCPGTQVVKTATGYDISATCNMGSGGKAAFKGKITGDYDSRYEVAMEVTTTGAAVDHMNRTAKMTVVNEWLGACPADMRPGDREMPDGTMINMTGFDPAKAKALAAQGGAKPQ